MPWPTPWETEPWVTPSLNAAAIIELPGVALPVRLRGKRGGELLFASSTQTLIRNQAHLLRLDPNSADLLRDLNRCFREPDPAVRAAAHTVADEVGARLGYLLLMLVRGDIVNRAARPAYSLWSDAHWDHWRQMRRVWIGGGQMAGALGPHAVAAAQRILVANGSALRVALAHNPQQLALLGVALGSPNTARRALLFDFGQTQVKRGVATLVNGQVVRVETLPPVPSPCGSLRGNTDREAAQQRFDGVIGRIGHAAAEVGAVDAVNVALATYLHDGHPRPHTDTCFGSLARVTRRLEDDLADAVAERLGYPVSLALRHDGAAAALAYAGTPDAAVITLGTAIGVGFVPPVQAVRFSAEWRLRVWSRT